MSQDTDTVSPGLPGCTYIYAPRGQAGEYAPLATNPFQKLGAAAYIKKDLQEYLPDGYPNPLRVAQHHAPSKLFSAASPLYRGTA